jgi:hypothetical protein
MLFEEGTVDEKHHHENDVHRILASARAAKDALTKFDQDAERQHDVPDLKAWRDAILRDKQEIAEAIAKFGASSQWTKPRSVSGTSSVWVL